MTNLEGDRPLDPSEAKLVLDDLRRLRELPPPSDPGSAGCVIAIVALITLVFMPVIARATELGSGALLAFGIGLGLVALVSGLVGIFGGGFVAGAISDDVEEAIGQLVVEFPDGDPDAMREAAIRILDGSTVSTGPTTVGTYDREEVADRLGDALDYVIRIERFLFGHGEIYPVFTLREDEGDSSKEEDWYQEKDR